MTEMLAVDSITVAYGHVVAVRDATLRVHQGEIVALIGPNGAGKTTLVSAVAGLLRPRAGTVRFRDQVVTGMPAHRVAGRGISLVPQGRQLFPSMSVLDNLRLGAYSPRARGTRDQMLDDVFRRFPVLQERQNSSAGELSGGQQQMLTVGRALMSRPEFLMLDEPSLGLAPLIVEEVSSVIRQLNRDGVTVLLVEQNIPMALELAARAYVMETGRIVDEGSAAELAETRSIEAAYLGIETKSEEGRQPDAD